MAFARPPNTTNERPESSSAKPKPRMPVGAELQGGTRGQLGDPPAHPSRTLRLSRPPSAEEPAEAPGDRGKGHGESAAHARSRTSLPPRSSRLPVRAAKDRRTQATAGAEGYMGPGMNVGTLSGPPKQEMPAVAYRRPEPFHNGGGKGSSLELEALKSENTRLKAEVRDLRQLLLTGKSQELPDEVAGAAGMLAALNRRNQLLKGQVLQLEKHALALEEELAAGDELVGEAEVCLQGMIQQLQAWVAQSGTEAPANCPEGRMPDSMLVRCEQWANHTLSRLQRCQVQAKAAQHDRCTDRQSNQGDFIPVGGNRFLTPPSADAIPPEARATSIRDIISGKRMSGLLQSPGLVHLLENRLSSLSEVMCSLSIALRASVLPAMRFLGDEHAAGLQAQVAEAAAIAAATSRDLSELAVLIPGRNSAGAENLRSDIQFKVDAYRNTETVHMWGSLDKLIPEPVGSEFALPTADEVLGALPRFASDSTAGQRVVRQLLDRFANRELRLTARQGLLEAELHSLAAVQSMQAEQWNYLCTAFRDTVQQWEAKVSDACSRGQDSLRTVLDAARKLLQDPSESRVKKMVNLLAIHMSGLESLPGLLESPKAVLSLEEATLGHLDTLESSYISTWEKFCEEQTARREQLVSHWHLRIANVTKQEPWESESCHPKQLLQAEKLSWQTALRGEASKSSDGAQQPCTVVHRRSKQETPQNRTSDGLSEPRNREPLTPTGCSHKCIDSRPPFDLEFLSQPAPEPPKTEQRRGVVKPRRKARLEERPPFSLD